MDIFGSEFGNDPAFPHAPVHWRRQDAADQALAEGLELRGDHWDAVRAMQEYYARHAEGGINMRELHDALDERFHGQGGIRYLYQLFPGGPIAQGCRIAGLHAPPGAVDRGFGSVA